MAYKLARDRVIGWFLAVWPLPVGLIMTIFADRFTANSWRFAAGIPGGYPMWAGILIACGLLMVLSMLLAANVHRIAGFITGCFLVGSWWVLLGGLFAYTAVKDPLANPLGGVVWTGIGLLYWIWAYHESKRL